MEWGFDGESSKKEVLDLLEKFDNVSETDEYISFEQRRIRNITSTKLRSLIHSIEELPRKYVSEISIFMNPDNEYSSSYWRYNSDIMVKNVDDLICKINEEVSEKRHQR